MLLQKAQAGCGLSSWKEGLLIQELYWGAGIIRMNKEEKRAVFRNC